MPSGLSPDTASKYADFVNQGLIEELTGLVYEQWCSTYWRALLLLNWCKLDIGYQNYKDRDRRFYMFWDHCTKDPDCFGLVMVKHRREGASYKVQLCCYMRLLQLQCSWRYYK